MATGISDRPAADAEAHEAPPLTVPLHAGPLRLVFDRGELRFIRLGEREVLHGIYATLRAADWVDVPARLEELSISAGPESFLVEFRARHRAGDVRFDWTGRLEGHGDGRIVYTMDGRAGSTFLRNRIGLCVLHGAAECAGEACTVETTDGRRQTAHFPRLIAPHQPFEDVRAIVHEPVSGVFAEVRVEGDTFETEDQRNWSDASFKTYSTPLALPFPVEVKEGTRIRQRVTLSLRGASAGSIAAAAESVPGVLPKKRGGTEPVAVTVDRSRQAPCPAIGLGGAERVALGEADVDALRPLAPGHLRADLRLEGEAWPEALERAAANARRLSAPLELALFLPEQPQRALHALAARVAGLSAPVCRWLLFRAKDGVTADLDLAPARAALSASAPGARFGGGADGYFAELNRRRPAAAALDLVSFSLTPQVHAFDDATLFESAGSLAVLAETAGSFAAGRPLAISPVTLRPRRDKRPPSWRASGEPPFTDDPRQATATAAAWALAFVGAAAWAGISSLTLFELLGPRGVAVDGRRFPVGNALAELASLPAAVVLASRSTRPERVQVLAAGSGPRLRVFVANVTSEVHPVHLEGLTGAARCAPLGSDDAGEPLDETLSVPPHSVVRLDVQG